MCAGSLSRNALRINPLEEEKTRLGRAAVVTVVTSADPLGSSGARIAYRIVPG